MKHHMLILTLVFVLLGFMPNVHASSGSVNAADFPQKLADALNVSLFVGQLLASLIFMSLFLLPSMLIAGYFGGMGAVLYTIILVGLASSSVCVGLGWLPPWVFAILVLTDVIVFGQKIMEKL